MAGIDTAREVGLTPQRATRMFLAFLAVAVLLIALLSLETSPTSSADAGDEGTELVTELIQRQGPPPDRPPSPPPGQPDGPGEACDTPAGEDNRNPHCRDHS